MMKCLISLDPGSEKCGYAVVKPDLQVLEKGIVPLGDLSKTLNHLLAYHPEMILLGKGTNSGAVRDLIKDMNLELEVCFGDEKNTTFEARRLYFQDHPPVGFWRLVPLSMQIPPCPVDDYAAILIAGRYLREKRTIAT